jgi:hypothetical protein
MDNLLDDSLDETVLLREVDVTELGSSFAKTGVGCEDGPTSLTLGSNDTTHGFVLVFCTNIAIYWVNTL